jgi:predicted DNA-binding transcriptional regulator
MEDMNYAVAPLFKRGLIELKKEIVDNKYLQCIHLTKDGIEYLEKLSPVESNS